MLSRRRRQPTCLPRPVRSASVPLPAHGPTRLALASFLGGSIWLVPFGVVFALAAVLVYELAWRRFPTNPIWVAELGTGALWGALFVI